MDATAAARAPEPTEALPERLRQVGALPSAALYLTEPVRGAIDLAISPLTRPVLARARRGDGHGVLVLPGLLASDGSTAPLRSWLRRRGYYVRGWRLGRNLGPSEQVLEGMPEAVRDLSERTGGPVSVIGWSLGGIYARHLALTHPESVRQVITLGSPYGVAHGHRTHADTTFDRLAWLHARPLRVPGRAGLGDRPRVPSTSFYSRLDGVVGWRACIGEVSELHQNVEVRCSHLGFGFDAATMYAVADRLATRPDDWHPFAPPTLVRPLYGRLDG